MWMFDDVGGMFAIDLNLYGFFRSGAGGSYFVVHSFEERTIAWFVRVCVYFGTRGY